MTNKKKAREIAHDCFRRGQLGLIAIDTESAGCDCAMQAMEWKDEQFAKKKQQWIDKACEFISKHADEYVTPDEESYRMGCGVDYLETNMFIEDFKNYMKGDEK